MDLGIKNKVAFVSASTSGIGYGIAKALLLEGVHVYVNGRTKKSVDAAIQKFYLEGIEGHIYAAPFDLSEEEGAKALFSALPYVDILVNNLGFYEEKPFEEITDECWCHIFKINVLSGIRLSRFYFPKMLEANWGRIVFISSEAAVNISPYAMHYGATKETQISIARGLAELTKGTNVTVNSVLPGITLTAGVEAFITDSMREQNLTFEQFQEEYFNNIKPSSLIKRFETVDEIAKTVAFVCSILASGINGSAIHVEGGVIRSVS